MMDNLVTALYGAFYNPQTGQGYVTKSVVNGRIVWTPACDPSNATSISGIPRNDGEGLLCYILRVLTLYNPTTYAQTNGNGTQVITATNFTNSTWTGGTITNPIGLTKSNVGLNNVDNTSDATKPTSGPQQTYIANAITAALAGFVPLSVQSLAGGTTYAIPYQAAPSTTAFISIAAAGLVLTSNGPGSAPSWQAASNVNTNANNLVGGTAGDVPVQTAAGVTSFISAGLNNYVLKSNGAGQIPTYVEKAPLAVASDTAVVSTNIAGGAAGGVPYQTGAGATAILAAGTGTQVLGGGATPSWQNVNTTPTASTIVKRTNTGNIEAVGFIGSTFSGNAATATALTAVPGLSSGTYGSASGYPIVSVNTGGQITGISVQNAPAQPTVFRFPEVVSGGVGWGTEQRTAFIDSLRNVRVAGDNGSGRLGVGDDVANTNAPGFMVAPLDLLAGEQAERLYVCPRNTYVLTNLGNIYACGGNGAGQLGSGVAGSAVNRFFRITTLTNIVSFCVNTSQINNLDTNTFCLAARSDGTLWGWGNNSNGQLGNSTTSSAVSTPVQITANGMGARFITKVYCDGHLGFSFVIDQNKEVYATGYNAYGNLGINSISQATVFTRCVDDSLTPMTADEVFITGAWDGTTSLESSSYILLNGLLYSTGGNTAGQLGQGNTSVRNNFKLITGLTNVEQVALSQGSLINNGNSVAAITTAGVLWVWGNNTGGQLAIGTTANQLTPTLASNLAGLTVSKAQFCGSQNNGAAPNGQVRMHVLTNDGRLRTAGVGSGLANAGRGFGNGLNSANSTTFVTALQNGITYTDFRLFGSPTTETMFLRGTDGNLYAYGSNTNFMAGASTGVWVTAPQRANFY
jgi:alpha-tubulin suppressor-like RCC1 family protein